MTTTKTDFETLGYFEDLQSMEHPYKYFGSRRVETPDRKLGIEGRTEITITAPLVLKKGHKEVKLNASEKRPVKCWATLQRLCGRIKPNYNGN